MKGISFEHAFILLGFPMFVSCQSVPEPRSILQMAIAAHGGEEQINKPRLGVLKGASKVDGSEVSQEEFFDLPKRWRRVTSGTFKGEKRTSYDVMNEGKFWHWDDGEEPTEVKNQTGPDPQFGIMFLLPRLLMEKVKLSPLPTQKINGQSALGLRATMDGGVSDYYFDVKTNLLVQSNFKWQPEPGKEFESKTIFGQYKEMDGVKFPYRRTSYIKGEDFKDYILLSDFTITELRLLKKFPDDLFSPPKKK